jgi:hypothetical protein
VEAAEVGAQWEKGVGQEGVTVGWWRLRHETETPTLREPSIIDKIRINMSMRGFSMVEEGWGRVADCMASSGQGWHRRLSRLSLMLKHAE